MADLKIHFHELDTDYSFHKLGYIFKSEVSDNCVSISNDYGSGKIHKFRLDDGLYIRIWNVDIYKALELIRIAHPQPYRKSFNLVFIFSPKNVIYRNDANKVIINFNRLKNVLFTSSDVTINFEIIPHNTIQAIDITLRADWLERIFPDAGPEFLALLKSMIESESPVTLMEPTTLEEYQALVELYSPDSTKELFIKSRVMFIISSFLSRITNREQNDLYSSASINYSQLMYLEDIITANIKKTLPPLEVIARKVNMSISSLKRHFKSLYNKNIYEYYLDKKMEYAKRLIIENEFNTNEVAGILGYDNVSHFIETFKKFHGVSPGSIHD
ncbi:MAG: helix-turn-helix transcriptional regulator [Chitinophagaceae bacterium]|nr:helix-turn-helix transcriptional regulator [Chitinophagaceae bacterium]